MSRSWLQTTDSETGLIAVSSVDELLNDSKQRKRVFTLRRTFTKITFNATWSFDVFSGLNPNGLESVQ